MKPSRTRFGVVALAISLAILSYMQRVAISEAALPIARDFHITKKELGFVFGAFGLSYALFEIPMGLLGDRLGSRRVLAQIVIAWSFMTAMTGAAWNFASLCVIRFLFGAGEAGCFPNLTRMLTVWLPARERGIAQGFMWAFTRWGGAVTPPLALLFITLFGWRSAFVIFASLGIIWSLAFIYWFRDDPATHRGVNHAELELLQKSRRLVTHQPEEVHWFSLLLTRQILALVLQYFCFSYVWYFYVTWLPTYLREARGQSPQQTATLSMLPLLFGGFGALTGGIIPNCVPRRLIAFYGFLGTCILLFAFPHVRSVLPAMFVMGMASFCSDVTMPISWDACAQIGGPHTATVAAAMNMLGNLAGFVAPVVGGLILERTGGNWNRLIYTMVAAAGVSSLCWIYLDPEQFGKSKATLPEQESLA